MVRLEVVNVPAITVIFDEAQSNSVAVSQLILKLSRTFNEISSREFTAGFITCLKQVFRSKVEFNNSADRVIEFAIDFLISIAKLNSTKNDPPPDECTKLLYDVFSFFSKVHGVSDTIIRKRVCQCVVKFFSRLNADADLDCDICDVIVEMMKERIKDKVPIIRMQAVLAIFRLQDKTDSDCPVTKLLVNCVETDSSAEVRKLALSKLPLSNKAHMLKIVYRVDDVSEKVRMEAYKVLSKLHFKQFTIEFRKKLLHTGLYDNNDSVKSTVKKTLLPAWLQRMDGNILTLLEALDLNVDSMECMTRAIMALFEEQPSDDTREIIDSLLDRLNVISYDKLTCESAFLWRCFVFYCSNMVSEKNDYRWDSSSSFDAAEIGLLPDLSIFCEYIKTYFNCAISNEDVEKSWQKREQEFILIQLIELCKVYDYADEVGRKELKQLCLDLLRCVDMKTIRHVVELYFMLQTSLPDSISKISELINDLLNPPFQDNITEENENTNDESLKIPRERHSESISDPNIKFKLAQLDVKLEELKEAQEEAILLEEYAKAEELKLQIANVRAKIGEVKNSFFDKQISVNNDTRIVDNDLLESLEEEDVANPLQNIEIDTVERCITILRETLHLTLIKTLTPEFRTLVQVLVLPALRSNNAAVAPIATEVLGSFCLRDKSLAKEYFTTFFALCGNSEICVSALKVIFDFLLCFGPTAFNINNFDEYEKKNSESDENSDDDFESDGDETIKNSDETKNSEDMISGYTFISILVDLLDDESMEVRLVVVHGLCQLMATGKLKSAKVLSRLILMWFHPSSKVSVDIRDCLNFFFPFFAKQCPWALSLFENAIIPTMVTLFNAPFHNPLSEVDQKCVVKVLCDIVSPSFVQSAGFNVHFNLAVLFCNTIIDLSDLNHQAVLLKGLNHLDLSNIDSSALTTLLNLLQKMIRKFKRKSYRKLIVDVERIIKKISTVQKCSLEESTTTTSSRASSIV